MNTSGYVNEDLDRINKGFPKKIIKFRKNLWKINLAPV